MNPPNRTPLSLLAVLLVIALAAAACGSSSTESTTTDSTATADTTGDETSVADTAGDEASSDDTAVDEPVEATTSTEGPVDDTTAPVADSGDELASRSAVITAAQWSDNTTITIDGDMATFASDGLPSHEFLDTYLGDGQDGKFIAGGVESYDANFSFPVVPTPADGAQDTPNGAIGVAISGAVFFNPFEGDGSGTVANDDNATIDGIPFIDACGGHPLPNGQSYHYHGVPFCITDAIDADGQHSEIIGFLFDGYALYGPQDVGGEEPTDLDECMGHVGPTPDFAEDTYHYHVSTQANYISACFNGVAAETRRGR